MRSQALPEAYHDSEHFYWFSIDKILKQHILYAKNLEAELMSGHPTSDIDLEEGWVTALGKLEPLQEEQK